MEIDNGDDDYESNNEDEEDISPYTLRRRPRGDAVAAARTNSSRKKSKSDGDSEPTTNKLPTNLKSITKYLEHLSKQLKGMEYDEKASLRVVYSVLMLQKEYLQNKQKKPELYKAGFVRARACALFGISTHTYGKIMKAFFNSKTDSRLYTSGRGRGNFSKKETRIPQTRAVVIGIREFVRERRVKRKRTTAKQVLEYCIEQGFVKVNKDSDDAELFDKKSYETAYRSMRRWLERNEYKRGRRTGNLALKEQLTVQRDLYLKAFFTNRELPANERLREVYLDESYIHQHYKKTQDSLWDPNDDQDIQFEKEKHKGNRYCFLCAIQGPNPLVFEPSDVAGTDAEAKLLDKLKLSTLEKKDRGGIVPNSVWSFCPQQKKDHKGDYHKVFKADNFEQWWRDQLIPNLHQPSIIIMDNASYHKGYVDKYPKANARKAEFVAFCVAKNIDFDVRDTKPILRDKVRAYKKTQKTACELMAEEHGHKVLYTPPYHSDLQPIELLWAKLKGNIGRKYDTDTTMTVLKERLDGEFTLALDWNESIEGFIRKSTATAHGFYTSAQEEDKDDQRGQEEESKADEVASEAGSEESGDLGNSDSEEEMDLVGL